MGYDAALRRRFEAIASGIIVYDPQGRIIYANRLAEEILNCPWSSMANQLGYDSSWTVVDVAGNSVPTHELPVFVTAASGQAVRNQVLGLRRTAGEPLRWLLVNSAPVFEPQTKRLLEIIVTLSDISALLGAEAALRESERKLIFALQSIHAGEWEMNLQDLSIQYSPRSAAIFLGEGWSDNLRSDYDEALTYFIAEDRDLVERAFHAAVGEKRAFDLEGRILRGDGVERWVQIIGRPYETGGVTGSLSGIVVDITDKKVLELSQRQSIIQNYETIAQEIVKKFDLLHFVVDETLCFLYFNQAIADHFKLLYGTDIELGGNYSAYVSDSAKKNQLQRIMQRALTGEVFVFEHYFAVDDCQLRCLEAVYCPVRNEHGQVLGVSVFAYDVSERKMAQNLLQANEYRYRKLVEDTNLIFLHLNEWGEILFMNSFGCEFFEYELAELVGARFDAALMPDFSSVRRNLKRLFLRLLRRRSTMNRRQVLELMTYSGKRVWVEWSYHWADEADQPGRVGLIAAGMDVTRAMRSRLEEKHGYRRRRRQELMNDAVGGKLSAEEFDERARGLDLALAYPLGCLLFQTECAKVATVNNEENQRQFDSLVDWLHELETGIVWQTADGIGVLLPLSKQSKLEAEAWIRNKAKMLEQKLQLYKPGTFWKCGVAQAPTAETTLPELYFQARAALSYGPALLGDRAVYHWRDLGSYQLLVKDLDSAHTARFVDDQLGPLLAMEEGSAKTELFHTLRELVSFDSVDAIAQRLHVHRGTVRYRRAVLSKLLGRELDSPPLLLDLSIAVKLWEIRRCQN